MKNETTKLIVVLVYIYDEHYETIPKPHKLLVSIILPVHVSITGYILIIQHNVNQYIAGYKRQWKMYLAACWV